MSAKAPTSDANPFWGNATTVARVYQVAPSDVITTLMTLVCGLAGSRVTVEGSPPHPLDFSLLLATDCDREPAWLPLILDPLAEFQRDYSSKIGAAIRAINNPVAARTCLHAADHLRKHDHVFEEEVQSLEDSAAFLLRSYGWAFSHHVGRSGALLPASGARKQLLCIFGGINQLRLLVRQAEHPRGILGPSRQDSKTPEVDLLGWVDEHRMGKVMRSAGHPLTGFTPLVLPVTVGHRPETEGIGLTSSIVHVLRELLSDRWIELPWCFQPAEKIHTAIAKVEGSFHAAVEQAPESARPWMSILPSLPARFVAGNHLVTHLLGDRDCQHGRADLTKAALELAIVIKKRLVAWLPRVLPGVSKAALSDLDLKVLDVARRHGPLTGRELQRRVHKLTARERDASLARLATAGMITCQGRLILPADHAPDHERPPFCQRP